MQGAVLPGFIKVVAGRDHLGLERLGRFPADLAEVGRLPRPHQGLEVRVGLVAQDLYLEVPAARRPPAVVSRLTRGDRARVLAIERICLEDRQAPGREGEFQRRLGTPGNHQEAVPAQAPRLRPARGGCRRRARESMGPTGAEPPAPLQVPAPDMEHRVDQEVAVPGPQVTEADVLGVPQQPGGLMIAAGGPLVQGADAKGDRDAEALGSESAACRSWMHAGNLTPAPPLPDSAPGLYVCEPFHKAFLSQ